MRCDEILDAAMMREVLWLQLVKYREQQKQHQNPQKTPDYLVMNSASRARLIFLLQKDPFVDRNFSEILGAKICITVEGGMYDNTFLAEFVQVTKT